MGIRRKSGNFAFAFTKRNVWRDARVAEEARLESV